MGDDAYAQTAPDMDRRPVATREQLSDINIEPEPGPLPARREADRPRAGVLPHEPPRGLAQENIRVIVRHSDQVNELFMAIAEAQAMDGYGDIEKTKTARVSSRKGEGSSYTYDYETLDDVLKATRPFLAKCGVASMQFAFPGDRSMTIRTMLGHKSGQWIYNDLSAMIPMPDPQGVGSAESYLRRYAMKAICNVAARDEDDDGNAASRQQERNSEPPRPAQRRSEQAKGSGGEASTPAGQAEPSPHAAGTQPSNVGIIVNPPQEKSGGLIAALDTGYVFATRDQELMKAVRRMHVTGMRVEVTTQPASAPGFAPKLIEIAPQRG